MAHFDKNQIVAVYVSYANAAGGKHRPVLVIEDKNDTMTALVITSKYETKSDTIKRQYFEIQNWKEVGLSKPSWIDIRGQKSFSKFGLSFTPIGKLSQRDVERLAQFIDNFLSHLKKP